MWKWIVAIVTSIVIVLSPLSVLAGTSSDVTVTVRGYITGAPTGFTATYVSETQVDLTWVKHPFATYTVIRVKDNGYPADPLDGYLVYWGDGEIKSDTAVNFDEHLGNRYYRAWSEDDGGGYSSNYAEASVGGIGVTLLAEAFHMFIVMLVIASLNALAFWQNRLFLYAMLFPVDISYGLYLARNSTENYLWILGVVVAIIGTYSLYKAALMGLEEYRSRKGG